MGMANSKRRDSAKAPLGYSGWIFADVWEAIADRFPESSAQSCGGNEQSWPSFDRRADAIAGHLVASGLTHQSKVAEYLFNGPEYLEVTYACSKAGLVPVNTNYRYTEDELEYLWNDADVEAVVFHGDFVERCALLRDRLPQIRLWLWVNGPTGEACPDWAEPYEEVARGHVGRFLPRWGRSGDDLFLLYTGGTTGLPKGVMWPQHSLFSMLAEVNRLRLPDEFDPVGYACSLTKPGPRVLPAGPLMHGTALWLALPVLSRAGCVITLNDRQFDPRSLLDATVAARAKGLGIVGDAFGRPLLRVLESESTHWDLAGLRVISTSGVVCSASTKAGLLRHAPNAVIIDGLGSSESGSLGQAHAAPGQHLSGARFGIGPTTRVIDEKGFDVVPGSGTSGRLAVTGHIPIGYYGDEAKTAETFVNLDGRTHVVAGDWATVEADGTIILLGRGSSCINTGGEKVHPEEVEEALKALPNVRDVVVVGIPDERFGESVIALVEPEPGAVVDVADLLRALRGHIAGYKVPKRAFLVETIGRLPNGKADHTRLREVAISLGKADKDN